MSRTARTVGPVRRRTRRSGPRGIPESLYELIRFKYIELAVP